MMAMATLRVALIIAGSLTMTAVVGVASSATVPAAGAFASSGCGTSPLRAGSHRESLDVDGLTRSWVMRVPDTHDGRSPLPLVIELHGHSNEVFDQMDTSGLGKLGHDAGFVVAAPVGRGRIARWLFELDSPILDVSRANPDIAFIDALIDRLGDELCLDRSRVYITGLSNGAMMTSAVGCALADRVAAIAPVAGVVDFGDACQPARPVPMIAFHGTADQMLPFEGGFSSAVLAFSEVDMNLVFGDLPMIDDPVWTIPIADRVAGIAARNRCVPTPRNDPVGIAAVRTTWYCPTGADTELLVIRGGYHDWPTGAIDATSLMWEFFSEHALPRQYLRPERWVTTASDIGDLRLSLPADIVPFDTSGAIFANEPPPPSGPWFELLAEGPRTAEPQPTTDEPLVQWLLRKWPIGEIPHGPVTSRTRELPAGYAVELHTTLLNSPDNVVAVILYAVRTSDGVAFVVIDGPPDTMTRRAAEIELIMQLIEFGPGQP